MLDVGEQAPAFELPDLTGQLRGSQEAQGPVVAVFWKSACGTCDIALPYLQRLSEAYGPDGWQLLTVSQDAVEKSAAFARQHGLTFPVLIDGEGWPVSQQYDPDATPTLFLIGPDRTIEMVSVGFHKEELNEVSRRLAAHLGKAAQTIAEDDDGNPPFRPG